MLFALRKEGRALLFDEHAYDCSAVVNKNVSLVDPRHCREDMLHLFWSYSLPDTTMFPICQQKNWYNRRECSTGITPQADQDRKII